MILASQLLSTGFRDSPTSLIFLKTNDTLDAVMTAGYLNTYASQINIYELAAVYTIDEGMVLLKVINSGTTWSLDFPSSGGGGGGGNVSYTGTLIPGNLIQVNNASGIIEDAGVAVDDFLSSAGTTQMQAGAELLLDKGVGTEETQAVTINAQSGIITIGSAVSLPPQDVTFNYSVVMTNSKIKADSTVLLTNGPDSGNHVCMAQVATVIDGTCVITITNTSTTITDNIQGMQIFFAIF